MALAAVSSIASAGISEITDLRCEYLRNPLGLDVVTPRLSWIIRSDRRGTSQSAYRVLVASSAELLQSDTGDLWDSGKIDSSQSIQVEYTGKPLASGQACSWKVEVWDERGIALPWSAPATWTMGLLNPDDWAGKWIGPSPSPDKSDAPILRKEFEISQPVRRAMLYVCGLGYYELHLSGAKVGDHVLDPPVTKYDKRVLYVTYDVTSQLAQGRNAIGIILGNGWYDTTVSDAWDFDKAPWRARPQVRLQLNLEFADGSRRQVVTDSSWKMATGPWLFDQTRVGEIYDARKEIPGWTIAGFDDSRWQPAIVREPPAGRLAASNVEPIRVIQTIRPVKISQPKPGIYLFDLGQNIAGWPRLTVSGPAGATVSMRCGEVLAPDGTLDNSAIQSLVHSPDFQCDRFTLSGNGVEVWAPRFTYHGFQYVEVQGLPTPPGADTIVGEVVHSAFEPAGEFECSDPLLNRIETASKWSYLNNFVGIPTDCPQREKNGWTGDAQLAVAMGLEHFKGEASYTQWIDTFQDCMRADGKLPCIAPTSGWGYDVLDGPAWESAYLLIPWEMYRQSGDRRILTSHYDGFKKWIDFYTRLAKDHIVSYGLGDWEPVKTKTPAAITSTAYYYRDLLIVAETAELLGRGHEADHYRDLAQQVRQSFNSTFFDPKTGNYGDGSQTALACALYQGLAPDDQRPRVVENLVQAVHRAADHLDTGILGAKYILRALSDNGRGDIAWKLATQRTRPSWGNWIERGATTLWEDWDGKSSRNHVMFGDISAWFIEYLAGISPDDSAPGYKKIVIHPLLLGDLKSASATRQCMYGTIHCDWTRAGRGLSMNVTIPANTSATVYIPARDPAAVKEAMGPLADSDGIKVIRFESHAVVIQLESGDYRFTSRY